MEPYASDTLPACRAQHMPTLGIMQRQERPVCRSLLLSLVQASALLATKVFLIFIDISLRLRLHGSLLDIWIIFRRWWPSVWYYGKSVSSQRLGSGTTNQAPSNRSSSR